MEHQSPLNHARATRAYFPLLAIALVIGSLWTCVGCGATGGDATSESWAGVVFLRRVTGGVEVASRPGVVDKTIAYSGGYFVALTPDLRGYAVTSIEEAGDSGATQVLRIKTGPSLVEVARVPFVPGGQPVRGALKLVWLTADGRELLVLNEGTAEYVRIVGQDTRKIPIASDALDIAATDTSIYVLTSGSPARVRWTRRPIGEERPSSETVLEADADGLYGGAVDGEVLLWSRLPRVQDARGDLRLADLRTGTIESMPSPNGVVLRLMPVTRASRAVLEWWDEPHELLDGTMKIVFSVWDYSTGADLRSFVNKEGWELQCTDPPCEAIPLRVVE
jgi:hypothetical protein